MTKISVHRMCTERAPGVHRVGRPGIGYGAVLLTLLLMPVGAAAQSQTFALPDQCEAFLTVQSKDCSVDHHFICTGDPDGHQRRVSFDEQTMTYLGSIDHETQWIGSFHPLTGHSERLAPMPADPASLTELIATGYDSYDFQTLSDEIGTTRYVGEDTLTGNVVTIDGVTLDETTYDLTAYGEDGTELWSAAGNEFISREWRMFLSGTGVIDVPGDRFERDSMPVEFIYPGEAGFLSINPKHGCGVMMSSYQVVP